MFGQQNKFSFGATTPFSGGSNTFGASGGFGAQQPAAATTGGLFSGTNTSTTGGLFGAANTNATNVFGQTSQPSTGFGATTGGGGLFGSTTPQTGGLFGTPSTSTAFGAKTPNTGFGTSGGGLFGANTAATAPATGGLFGQTAAQPAGGLFAGASGGFGTGQTGTAVAKFNPPAGTDSVVKSGVTQSISTRHQCITAMKEYEGKSFEELRLEDYAAGRKNGAQAGSVGATPAGGLFGAATQPPVSQAGGLFGTQNKPAGFGGFGAAPASTASGGLFGQPAASTSLFGAATSKPLFSATNTTTSASTGFGGFGAATQPATTGGLFGQPQQKPAGLFGATTQSGGLFNTSTATSGFGATSTASGFGGFGATSQAGGLFGAKPGGFGATQTATGGLFNSKPATSGTGYAFGTSTASTGFGAQPGGLFGAKPGGFGTNTASLGTGFGTGLSTGTGTSLFNQPKPTLGTGLGTGFGAGTTGGFGGLATAAPNTGLGLGTSLGANNNPAVNAQGQLLQQQLMVLQMNPYGDDPLFSGLSQDTNRKRSAAVKPTNPAAQKASLANQHKVSPRPVAKIRPKAVHGSGKGRLFDGLDEDELFGADNFVPRKSVKQLTIRRRNTIHGTNDLNGSAASSLLADTSFTQNLDANTSILQNTPSILGSRNRLPKSRHISSSSDTEKHNDTDNVEFPQKGFMAGKDMPNPTAPTHMPSFDDSINVINARASNALGALDRTIDQSILELVEEDSTVEPHPAGIIMNRSGYYTMPSMEDLATMVDENNECLVENLVIGREGYGNVFFPGLTNVTGLNIDETVFFRRKEITVYPDDDKKPEEGKGLNKKAQVTLDNVWPNDKSTHTPIKCPKRLAAMGYQDKIEQATAKIGAKFIEYRVDTGSWVFEVKHFSKYGLLDDSDDEGEVISDPAKLKQLHAQQQQQLSIQKKPINLVEQAPSEKSDSVIPDEPILTAQDRLAALEKLGPEYIETSSDTKRKGLSADLGHYDSLETTPLKKLADTVEDMIDGTEILPSSHRLAESMEVSTKPVQNMKASFFDDMDDEPADFGGPRFTKLSKSTVLYPSPINASPKPALLSRTPSSLSSPSVSTFSQSLNSGVGYKPTEHSMTPPAFHIKPLPSFAPRNLTILPSGMPDVVQTRKVAGVRIERNIIPYSKSSFCGRHTDILDMALFHSRGFRVGWGPSGMLVHCANRPLDQTETVKEKTSSILPGTDSVRSLDNTPYKIYIEKLHMAQCSIKPNIEIIDHLNACFECQLNCSVSSNDTGIPLFGPTPGRELLHQQAQVTAQKSPELSSMDILSEQMDTVLTLCVALWGDLQIQDENNIDKSGHIYQMGRREAVSKWLFDSANKYIQQEIAYSTYQKSGTLQCILSYLTGRQIGEACKHAQENNHHRLALLMSQAVGSHRTRAMVAQQLQTWAQHKADEFINDVYLRIFSLLAGHMVWPSSHSVINVCQDLDWKRAFALHLWYDCPPTTTISGAVYQYQQAYQGKTPHGRYSCPPLPPYLESDLGLHMADKDNDDEEVTELYDTCYHLLCLWSDKSYPIKALLNPATSTPDPLDFRLSWFLWQCLKSLDYTHLSEYHDSQLCSSFASQLECLGLWHWAVFVLLHIPNHHSREYCTRELLERNIRLTDDKVYTEQENFVQNRLRVPQAWIHYAKALRAQQLGWHWEEAYHLMKASCMNTSHQVLLQHIAPDAIIHEDYVKLLQLLREMSPVEYSCSIKDWNIGGKLYLDYITMNQTIDEIKQGELGAYELEGLRPEVASLCNRIGGMACPTAKHRLCQSEMAKRTANLLRTLTQLQHEAEGTEINLPHLRAVILAPHISRLPMPEDYALQELRLLTRAYMLEMSTN